MTTWLCLKCVLMARRAELVGLDIAEPQIIVAYPDDQFFTWHGRVLLRRLSQSSWIWVTPDREVQVTDLAAGLHPDSPHRHVHRLLYSALRLMVNYDQLDLANQASGKLLFRRLVQVERTVRACPRSPSLTGLDKMIEMNLSHGGVLRTDEFTRHFAAVAEADARVMKQTRLLRDELKQTGSEKTDDDESPAAPGRRRRGKNV